MQRRRRRIRKKQVSRRPQGLTLIALSLLVVLLTSFVPVITEEVQSSLTSVITILHFFRVDLCSLSISLRQTFLLPPWIGFISRSYAANAEVSYSCTGLVKGEMSPFYHTAECRNILFLVNVS